MTKPTALKAPEPSLMAAQQIESLQNNLRVLSNRNTASMQCIQEITQANVELRAGIMMMEQQCMGYHQENEKLKALTKPNAEIERLNRVVEALDKQLASSMEVIAAKDAEIQAIKATPNDGA